MANEKRKAFCGLGIVSDRNWKPVLKTRKGWRQWAEREAAKLSRRDGFTWTGVVADTLDGNSFRISFGAMKL